MTYKLLVSFFFITTILNPVFGQEYFQQTVNTTIKVELDDKNFMLRAHEKIEYTNNSPNSLEFIYFHIWPNAYRNRTTAMGKQLTEDGNLAFHFANEKDLGFIDSLDFRSSDQKLSWSYHEDHIDICKVNLPKPLKPGKTIEITTPFLVKIPDAKFSRLGHVGESFQITQWFPKPAVYDKEGWHPYPYLTQGEFFSEYGTYDVFITLPKNYVVGATGDLVDGEKELKWLSEKAKSTANQLDSITKIQGPNSRKNEFPESSIEFKTLHYHQENVHDFALFADKRWHVLKGEVQLPHSKRKVTTWAMFTTPNAVLWADAIEYLNDATHYYSLWNGDYPYNHVTAVDGTIAAGGGMEYPNVTIIGSMGSPSFLEKVIVHEVGHNWFYGILGSDERKNAWMDEGLNSFNEYRYTITKYPRAKASISGLGKLFQIPNTPRLGAELLYNLNATSNIDQPMQLNAGKYTPLNYGGIVYSKSTLMFDFLKAYLGEEVFDNAMQQYFQKWKFKHPNPSDLREILESATDKDLRWFFDDGIKTAKKMDYKIAGFKKNNENGIESYKIKIKNRGQYAPPISVSLLSGDSIVATKWSDGFDRKGFVNLSGKNITAIKLDAGEFAPEFNRSNNQIRTSGLFKKIEPIKFQFLGGLDIPQKSTVYYAPSIGYNLYNGFMFGAAFYNHTIYQKKFEFMVMPMYSFRSKSLTGLGKIGYHYMPEKLFTDVYFSLGAESFDIRRESNSRSTYRKLAPSVKFDIKPASLRSKYRNSFEIAGISVWEGSGPVSVNFTDLLQITKLNYTFKNKQVLKPFSISTNVEHGRLTNSNILAANSSEHLSASVELKWRFNYNLDLKGMDIRLFAGHLINEPESSRFSWTLDGGTGFNDYRYDKIYLGRNEARYSNLLSQQINGQHGGFKVPVNFTSNTIFAANLEVEAPVSWLPISLFADVAAAPYQNKLSGSTQSATDFYFDFGLALTVPIKLEIPFKFIKIYVPLVYSKNIQNELKYNDVKFIETIRFTLEIKQYNPFQLRRDILH